MTKQRQHILLGILFVFYAVGVVGINSGYRSEFLALTPLHLLISFGCLLVSYGKPQTKRYLDICLVGVAGFALEYVGVHTGWLFGEYSYGENLGKEVGEIPLMMAVNWVLLCFTSTALVLHLGKNALLKAILASALMTGMDFLIEPVAIRSGFWDWETPEIPVYNYLCWFALSLPLNWWILQRKTTVQNKVSIGLFLMLAVFFGLLNWL